MTTVKVTSLPCCGRKPRPPENGWLDVADHRVTRECCPVRDRAGRQVGRRRAFLATLHRLLPETAELLGHADVTVVRWEELDR